MKAVGVAGLSGGGVVASYLAGLSDKIDAVVLANSLRLGQPLVQTERLDAAPYTELRFSELPSTPRDFLATTYKPLNWSLSTLADDPNLVLLALLPPTPLLVQFGDADPVNYLEVGQRRSSSCV